MEESKQIEEPKKFNLLEYTTIIYALLTFLGYSYIDFYYRCWGINIYSYLDISDFLLSFLNLFNTYLGYILYFALGVVIALLSSKVFDKINQSIKNKSGLLIFKIVIILIFVVLSIFLFYAINKDGFVVNIRFVFITSLIIYSSFYCLSIAKTTIKKIYNKVNSQLFNIVYILIFSYILIYFNAYSQYNTISKNKMSTIFNITSDTNNYKSNDTLRYIGATSKYIFIRNTKDSTNLIFDKSSIKNLSITEKRNTNK